MVLKKTLASPLDAVNPKGNQPWIFTGRTDAEAETPILWLHDGKNWLTGKDTDAGKDWRREEKGMTEGEMAGWHYLLNGHKFEQAPGDGGGKIRLSSGLWVSLGLHRYTGFQHFLGIFLLCIWLTLLLRNLEGTNYIFPFSFPISLYYLYFLKKYKQIPPFLISIKNLSTTWTTRIYSIAHGTLLNVTWQPGWEGSLEENGYMYTYGWIPLLWPPKTITALFVNQLHPNTK